MSETTNAVPMHFVCTHGQARDYIAAQERFFIGICNCRASRGSCERSRMDVCLAFSTGFELDGGDKRPATREEALALVAEADAKGLVARPFRDSTDPTKLDGICFCCPECCHYFNHPDAACDKGSLRETTRRGECSDCGLCVEVCHFGARRLEDGKLTIDSEKCYGCGLCVDACPASCIEMK